MSMSGNPRVEAIDLREAIAKAAFDAASYVPSDGENWVDSNRIPEGDDPDDWEPELMIWDYALDEWRKNGYRIADAVLAVLAQRGERTVAASIAAGEEEHHNVSEQLAEEARGRAEFDRDHGRGYDDVEF